MDAGSEMFVFGWIALHVSALAAACGTRLSVGSRVESFMHLMFFASMAAVGLAAWICHRQAVGSWGLSGITLIAMVIMAVIDLRRFSEPQHSQTVASDYRSSY